MLDQAAEILFAFVWISHCCLFCQGKLNVFVIDIMFAVTRLLDMAQKVIKTIEVGWPIAAFLLLGPAHLVCARFGGQWRAIGVGLIDNWIGEGILRAGYVDEPLFWAVFRQERHVCRIQASTVPDRGGLQDVTEGIDLQRERVLNARVRRVALVVVGDGLAGVREEHRVPVAVAGLHAPNREVLLGDGVGMLLFRCAVEGIDLLSQHRAFQGAAGFSLFFQCQAGWKYGIGKQQCFCCWVVCIVSSQCRFPVVFAVAFPNAGEEIGDMLASQIDAGMEPGLGEHRRHVGGGVHVRSCGQRAAARERGELFRVPLFHHAEATELALLAVEVAVVVGVAGDEAVAADVVVCLDALDHMHREGQPGDPRLAVALVLQVELGGRGVLDDGFGAEIVDGLDEQMRFLRRPSGSRSASAAAHHPVAAMTRPGTPCRCRADQWARWTPGRPRAGRRSVAAPCSNCSQIG